MPGTAVSSRQGWQAWQPCQAWQGDFLSNYERPVRRNLRSWGSRLTEGIAEVAGGDPHLLPGLLNNATLVLSYCGELELAERLCHRQARWSAAALDPDHPEYLAMVLQPLINVGRLHALTGRTASALRYFDEDFLAGKLFELGTPRVCGSLPRVAHNACVIDTLRLLLSAGKSPRAVIDRERADPGSQLAGVLDEAEILGCPAGTVPVLAPAWADYRELVLAVRSIGASKHRTEGMRDLAATIAALFCHGALDGLPAPTALRFGEQLAALLAGFGLAALSTAVWRSTLQRATDAGDEVATASCLAALREAEGADPSWADRLAELAAGSDYSRIRRLAGLGPAGPADFLPALVGAVAGVTAG